MANASQDELGTLAVKIGMNRAACRLVTLGARELEIAEPERPGERMEVLEGMEYVLSIVIESLGEVQEALTRE